jgi:hypothetical protein
MPLLFMREFLVRINIKGQRRRNPQLSDRTMTLSSIDQIPDLSNLRTRVKNLTQEEIFKEFSKKGRCQPSLITLNYQQGLSPENLEIMLNLLVPGGKMIIQYHNNDDPRTVDMLEFLSTLFPHTRIVQPDNTQTKTYFFVGRDFIKDKYDVSKQVLNQSKDTASVSTTKLQAQILNFNRSCAINKMKLIDSSLKKESIDSLDKEWVEMLSRC